MRCLFYCRTGLPGGCFLLDLNLPYQVGCFANNVLFVITSYSIHYTKLYEDQEVEQSGDQGEPGGDAEGGHGADGEQQDPAQIEQGPGEPVAGVPA